MSKFKRSCQQHLTLYTYIALYQGLLAIAYVRQMRQPDAVERLAMR